MKCKKCRYFYRVMVTKERHNPYPCCHILEDTGERPKPLTQECFKPRRKTLKIQCVKQLLISVGKLCQTLMELPNKQTLQS